MGTFRNPRKNANGNSRPQRRAVDLHACLQEALKEHQAGNIEAAKQVYERILHAHHDQPDALHYLGVIAYQQGNREQAVALISKAIALQPIPDMYQNLAVVQIASNDREGAINTLMQGSTRFPEAPMLAFNLAGAQRDAGRWQASRDTLKRLSDQYPDWVDVAINLANAERNLGNTDAAEALYIRALQINDRFAAAHSNLGALYSETGRIEQGVLHNRRAIELEPAYAPYAYNLGNALLAADRYGEAISWLQKCVELDSGYINGWLNLAAAFQLIGDLTAAIAANRRALELCPTAAKAFINQGTLALGLRRYEEALNFLKQGIRLEPSSFSAWTTAAEALRQLGRLDDARVALQRALELAPGYGRAYIVLAMLEEQAQRTSEAERALRQAFDAPKFTGLEAAAADRRIEAHLRLANLLSDTGRAKEAETAFKAGLDLATELRPWLRSLPDERTACSAPIVLFQPIGRAGSLFLHSLIDGHPEVTTLPAAIIKGFFGEGVWEGCCPDFRSDTWRQQLVSNFCARYEVLLDAASARPVPGNPLGSPVNVGRGFGLCEMGASRDQVLRINRDVFASALLEELNSRSEISATMFFRIVHQAYDRAIGRDPRERLVFFHIHNPDVNELAGSLIGNRNLRFLSIVREPLQAIESWMKMCLLDHDQPETLLGGYQDAVERLQLTLKQASHLSYGLYPSATIRLEDVKRDTEVALPALATWLGIEDHPSLRESTFGGLPYEAPSNVPVKGFDTSNLERRSGMLFSEHDQRVMNLLLYPIAVQYGYREADPAHLARELEWYVPLVSEPLDFEKKILGQLAAMCYQKDMTGPRRHFMSIAYRCIHLLEQFGTYPAMAPWLKIDKGMNQ